MAINNLLEYAEHKKLDVEAAADGVASIGDRLQSKFFYLMTNGLSEDAKTLEELAKVGPSDGTKAKMAQFLLKKDFYWASELPEVLLGRKIDSEYVLEMLRSPFGNRISELVVATLNSLEKRSSMHRKTIGDAKALCRGQLPEAVIEGALADAIWKYDFKKLATLIQETRMPSYETVQVGHNHYLAAGKVSESQQLTRITEIGPEKILVKNARLEYIGKGQLELFRESMELKPEFAHTLKVYGALVEYLRTSDPPQKPRYTCEQVEKTREYNRRTAEKRAADEALVRELEKLKDDTSFWPIAKVLVERFR